MWLSQQILDCLVSNIGQIITFSMNRKELSVIPTVLLVRCIAACVMRQWCLRKCYDHVFVALDFVKKEVEVIRKIFILDQDSFLRCGVDCISCFGALSSLTAVCVRVYPSKLRSGDQIAVRFADPRSNLVRKVSS